jgi:hypothetical protein
MLRFSPDRSARQDTTLMPPLYTPQPFLVN